MSRTQPFLVAAAVAALLVLGATSAHSQTNLSGSWFERSGAGTTIPIKTVIPCYEVVGPCAKVTAITGMVTARPASGITGQTTIPGAKNVVGASLTVPPGLFTLPASPRFIQVPLNATVRQLNTSISFYGPGTNRFKNTYAGTRKLAAGQWALSGQAARASANSSWLITTANNTTAPTPTTHDVTVNYTAGGNAFGGTMLMLLNSQPTAGSGGRLFLDGLFALGMSTWVATLPLQRTVIPPTNIPQTGNGQPAGAGWGTFWDGGQAPGGAYGGAANNGPCIVALPPNPSDCELYTTIAGIGGPPIFPFPPATSKIYGFAWTTGTVKMTNIDPNGNGQTTTLSARGRDTTVIGGPSSTVKRVLTLVAGGYRRRNSPGTPDPVTFSTGTSALQLELTPVPEPGTALAILGGAGVLGLVATRRKS